MNCKMIIGSINGENELSCNILNLALQYANQGADAVFLYNYTKDVASREEFLHTARELSKTIEIPFLIGLYAERFEDIKKAFYTGASQIVINYRALPDQNILKEASHRFGKDKLVMEVDYVLEFQAFLDVLDWSTIGINHIMLKHVEVSKLLREQLVKLDFDCYIRDSLTKNDLSELFGLNGVIGVATNYFQAKDLIRAKRALKESGVPVDLFEGVLMWKDFKVNQDGLIPVVTQDDKTNEVLMLAYMNQEAYQKTLDTGTMTYFSRSRQELWVKGETSGHYQYVKRLMIDCDCDTILARVKQIGSACHTGNTSCFYTELSRRAARSDYSLSVLSDVYKTIIDRKENPKEGSYTNYLFDKGIDKILKKCGEEATEIVIAAKNPDAEELKYEIADFLYHMMVLMAECNLDWEDVLKELGHRR